jgi:hypothetical protein
LPDIAASRAGTNRKWFVPVFLGLFALALTADQASAQNADPAGAETLTIDGVTAPRGEAAEDFRRVANRAGMRSNVTYAKGIKGTLPLDEAYQPPKEDLPRRTDPLINGPVAMIVVFVLLLVAAALWLRYGGSGMLLSSTPGELPQRPAAPDSWRMQDDPNLSTSDLLAQIAAMSDRRAALVRLLRHCLLQAGNLTDTRFARSDTEREAFRRLPAAWAGRGGLGGLLTATELAHYGGRAVSEDNFVQSLAAAREILSQRKLPYA